LIRKLPAKPENPSSSRKGRATSKIFITNRVRSSATDLTGGITPVHATARESLPCAVSAALVIPGKPRQAAEEAAREADRPDGTLWGPWVHRIAARRVNQAPAD
jgi:hypothetical protein